MWADLHIHTRYSDGNDTVAEVLALAQRAGITCVSITDHDCIDAYVIEDPAALAAPHGIEIVSGVELSAVHNGTDVHILGFGVDCRSSALREQLELNKKYRRQRLLKMAENLRVLLNIAIDRDEFELTLSGGAVSRLHLAQFLIRKNLVTDVRQAFDRLIGKASPAYLPANKEDISDVLRMVSSAGGVACIAHPFKYGFDKNGISQLQEKGVQGVEALYPGWPAACVQQYTWIADSLGMVKCGGSDYHGVNKDFCALGNTKVPMEWVAALKKRIEDGK